MVQVSRRDRGPLPPIDSAVGGLFQFPHLSVNPSLMWAFILFLKVKVSGEKILPVI